MKNFRHCLQVLAMATALALGACGGGSSSMSSGTSSNPTQPISMASGVLSAFGSGGGVGGVVVNGAEYATGNSTAVVDGDAEDTPTSVAGLQVGMTVDVDAATSVWGPMASLVRFSSAVRGEVDAAPSGSTLTVLGQTVQVTSATSFAGSKTSGGSTTAITQLSDIGVGDYVVVYGFLQCTSTGATCTSTQVVATLIFEPGTVGVFRTEGYAQSVDPASNSFSINGLMIHYATMGTSATVCKPTPCPSIASGDFVEVRTTTPVAPAAKPVLTASYIKTTSQVPVLATGSTVSIEGLVANLDTSTDTFDVRGISIDGSNLASTLAMLANGQIVVVTGTVSSDGTIVATAISTEKRETFSVMAPLDSDSAFLDTLTVLGQTFTVNSATRFVDWAEGVRPFNLNNFATVLSVGDQLIVSGYATASGNVATRVERIPTPLTPTVGAQGIVTADSSSADTLSIGGVTATLGSSTMLRYQGAGSNPTLGGFFAALTVNSSVAWVIGTAGASAGAITATSAVALPTTCQWAFGPN